MEIPRLIVVVLMASLPSSLALQVPSWMNRFDGLRRGGDVEMKSYQFQQNNGKVSTLAYRYKPASPGHERDTPLFLVHPVGIGLSSWFWDKFLDEWKGSAVYAPDLIGCGKSDPWNPDEQGMSFPLGWVEGCEALMKKQNSCIVVAQGGLAPVGVMLASRNTKCVSHLVLTSPPTWKDMTTAVPESELEFNYNFLRSKLAGGLAFRLLETRWAIAFFSDIFLFEEKSDDVWLQNAVSECQPERRPPIMAFNAGFCQHRSYEMEMKRDMAKLESVLVLQGRDDQSRAKERTEYETEISNCRIETVIGKNVLPWESPVAVAQQLKALTSLTRTRP